RAADVVATKDAAKIVDFVRTRIAVAPPFENSDPVANRRWGTAATLRSGLGTMRERADLLADLLTQAGFKADVQIADRPSSITVENLSKAIPAPAFAPDQARVQLAAQLLRQAGAPAPAKQHDLNPGPDPVPAILSTLPDDAQKVGNLRGDLLPQLVPLVVYT